MRSVVHLAIATGRTARDRSFVLRGALPAVKKKHFAAVTEPKDAAEPLRKLDSFCPKTQPDERG